jgi:hypothetical protein
MLDDIKSKKSLYAALVSPTRPAIERPQFGYM